MAVLRVGIGCTRWLHVLRLMRPRKWQGWGRGSGCRLRLLSRSHLFTMLRAELQPDAAAGFQVHWRQGLCMVRAVVLLVIRRMGNLGACLLLPSGDDWSL